MVNEDLGPCTVSYNGVDLGYTEGSVKFMYEGVYKTTQYDQTGETVQNVISMGKKCEVDVPLADTAQAKLDEMIMGAVDGTTVFKLINSVGVDGRAAAKQLILTRVGSSDALDKLYVPLAVPTEKIDWGFGKDGQRVSMVKFIGLPSVTSPNVGLIAYAGTL